MRGPADQDYDKRRPESQAHGFKKAFVAPFEDTVRVFKKPVAKNKKYNQAYHAEPEHEPEIQAVYVLKVECQGVWHLKREIPQRQYAVAQNWQSKNPPGHIHIKAVPDER